jgi:succinate-semialdehyde dehydrogenase/glutarate-semialdehyde dehydrogenase
MAIEVVSPTTGEVISRYDEASRKTVRTALGAVARAAPGWRDTSFADRADPLREAARLLRRDAHDHAALMAREMGKPVREGQAEVEKCAWACEYFAEHGADFLATQPVETEAERSYVAFEPLGVVLGVMPWNFPFWQVFRFAAPTLMAGNAVLLKHSTQVPGCAEAIEAILEKAGFPPDVLRAVRIGSMRVGGLIRNPLVRAVAFTGSVEAGRTVARRAGAALKKAVLELGGSDPYLILSDADVESAASVCAQSRLANAGQSCVAAKRFIVVAGRRREFEELLVAKMKEARMGDPLDPTTTLGPLVDVESRQRLQAQVRRSLQLGAVRLLGDDPPAGKGAFHPPAVLSDVTPGMPAFDEELFGPVAAVAPAADERDALRLANASRFGLGAAVFTRDLGRAEHVARQLEAGVVAVNGMVRSDPRMPFGGIKESGWGRELSAFGIREFVNVKSVKVAPVGA